MWKAEVLGWRCGTVRSFISSKILGSCSDSILNLIGGIVLTRRSPVSKSVFCPSRLRAPIKLACTPWFKPLIWFKLSDLGDYGTLSASDLAIGWVEFHIRSFHRILLHSFWSSSSGHIRYKLVLGEPSKKRVLRSAFQALILWRLYLAPRAISSDYLSGTY